MKRQISCEWTWLAALLINSFAITILVRSSFGISTLSSLPLVLYEIFPVLSFGMTNFLVQTVLLVAVMAITRQPKVSYLFSFLISFVFGLLIDLMGVLTAGWPHTLAFRIFLFLAGWGLISLGGAMFVLSRLPLMPFDCAVRDLAVYLHRPVRPIKTLLDLLFVTSAALLSVHFLKTLVGIGVGTLIMAGSTGTLVQFFIDLLQSHADFVCTTSLGRKLAAIAAIQPR